MSRFEFGRIDLAISSLMSNQPVAVELKPTREQCQRVAVTPPVNLTVSILSRVCIHLIHFIVIES